MESNKISYKDERFRRGMTKEELLELIKTLKFRNEDELNTLLTYADNPIIRMTKDKTFGNGEVYKLRYYGDAKVDEVEEGIYIVLPGAGIIPHRHSETDGISETYYSLAGDKIEYNGTEFDILTAELGMYHGIDMSSTPKIVKYIKNNSFIKNNENNKSR